jgi:sensor c-di-GMP phosphodiesterase-like protein
MVLYTGLFKGNLWLTSIIVVAPVALIILLFISFFNISALKKLIISQNKRLKDSINKHFLYVYFLLFFYYIIATVFFGQYSERYRLPVMVVFIIPLLGYFIASFDRKQFFNRVALGCKCFVVVLFLTIWVFQARKAISNKQRLNNAIESVKGVHGID